MVAVSALAGWSRGVTITLSNQTILDSRINATAQATITIDSSGTVTDQNLTVLESWISVPAQVGNYDVRATLSSGSTPTGTMGTWLNCATDRTWYVVDTTANGSMVTSTFLLEIRDTSSGLVQDSATITLTASNESGA